jgi:uncharacterized membrane protein YbhN (UPF0104 family)
MVIASTSCSSFLRALRWRVLLNARAHFDVMTVFWATMAGYLGNNFLPARAGEVIRSFIISSHSTLTRTYVLTTALAERMMDAIALVLWSGIVLMGVHPKPAWLDQLSRTLAFGAAAGLLVVIVLPHARGLCEGIIRRLPFSQKLLPLAEQILLGLGTFHDLRRLAAFVAYTVVIWSLDAYTVVLGGRALDLEIHYSTAALLICGMGLGSALPSTPGYVGIYQFVAVSVLTPFGIAKDAALALILILQALGYVVVVMFGVPGLYRFKGWRTALSASGTSGRSATTAGLQ